MSKEYHHYKGMMGKPYLGHWDLNPEEDLVLTIKEVKPEIVKNKQGEKERAILYFKEPYKPMVLNTENGDMIVSLYKTGDPKAWIGKQIQVYIKHNVRLPDGGRGPAIRVRPSIPKGAPERKKEVLTKLMKAWPNVVKYVQTDGADALKKVEANYTLSPEIKQELQNLIDNAKS